MALIQSSDGEIDLIITDVIMPEMNGRDFAAQVNSLYPNIKTLFISGFTIQKPFSIKDLAVKVHKVIENQ